MPNRSVGADVGLTGKLLLEQGHGLTRRPIEAAAAGRAPFETTVSAEVPGRRFRAALLFGRGHGCDVHAHFVHSARAYRVAPRRLHAKEAGPRGRPRSAARPNAAPPRPKIGRRAALRRDEGRDLRGSPDFRFRKSEITATGRTFTRDGCPLRRDALTRPAGPHSSAREARPMADSRRDTRCRRQPHSSQSPFHATSPSPGRGPGPSVPVRAFRPVSSCHVVTYSPLASRHCPTSSTPILR